jgi:hypothetical protein
MRVWAIPLLPMLLAVPAAAQDAAEAGAVSAASDAGAQAPPVALDKLLTLPKTHVYSVDKKGGASEAEWRARFREMREDLEEQQAELKDDEEELAKVAGAKSAWQFTAPGMGNAAVGDSTVSYELRQKVRRGRGKVRQLEYELRELEVRANLAEVPEAWRR